MKRILTLTILIWVVGLSSAWSYGLGDQYYGLTYHYTPQESVAPSGGYLPYVPSYVKVIDDGVLYAMNTTGTGQLFCAYNLTTNTTVWCVDVGSYDGINAFYPFIVEDSMVVQLTGVNEVMIAEDGTKYYNETSPDYYNWIGNTQYATPYYNNNTHMGLYFTTSDYSNYRRYFVSTRLEYYNSSLYKFQQPENALGMNTLAMRGVEAASDNPQHIAGMNKPIYDKYNNLIIQVGKQGYDGGYPLIYSYGNQTYVSLDPDILPLKFNKGCWVDSSCNYSGTGYSEYCSKTGGIMNTSIYTCANDGQCGAGPAHHCQYVEAEGINKCVSDTTPGSCVMTLNHSCIITIPTPQLQVAYTYDYLTKMLYLFVEDGSHMIIYNQNVGACTFTGNTNLTASLFGSYGAGVTATGTNYISQSPIMDAGYIYLAWQNTTGHYFQKIDRNTKTVVYTKTLTKDIYNSSDSGDISSFNPGYIGYDTASKDVYVFVDTNNFIKFGQLNYTTCPSEDPHTADPMCYTNGTLNLINHQYCDTDVSPTESQPCTDKLDLDVACNRDWQCVNEAVQGWCAIDINDTCAARGAALDYNCTTGILSWGQASNPSTGTFYAYMITSGNESTLFDSYSVEQNLVAMVYNQTQTSITINITSSLFYNVIAANSESKEYWKTDIILGSDVLPTTTTTSTTTSTTLTTTTTTSTSTSTTLIGGNYTLTVTADKAAYNLNETLIAEAFKAYFKFRGTIVDGGSCRFYIDDNVFLHSDVPAFGVMDQIPGSYYYKHNWVQVRDNISAQNTWVNVTCSNGAFSVNNATNVSINGFQVGTNPVLEFVDRLTEGNIGDYRYLTVRFRLANGTIIGNATCEHYINGVRQADALIELASHLYQKIYRYPELGYYEYAVSCTNDEWTTNYTIQDSFNVTGFYGTTTTTLGLGVTTTLPPGATTTTTLFPPSCGRPYTSLCHCSDTLSLEGCRNDGSEHCNGTYCIPDQCIIGSSCEIDGYCCGLMLWDDNHTGTYVRERTCNGEWCIFQSSSGYQNSSTAMRIYPLSGITYYDGLNYIYLAVCEDNTNGVHITTGSVATTTSYQLLTSAKTPGISQMYTPKPFSTTKSDKTALIPELCGWSGTGGKYALIHFESVYQGGIPSFENKYIRVEKESFKVNMTHTNPIQLTLSRNGTCFATSSSLNPYTQIGNTTGITFTFDKEDYVNNSGMIQVFCNSTYGEPYSLTEGGGGAWFLKALFLLLLNFVVTLALNLIGIDNFQWQNWYTPLVVIIVIIPLPLLYLIYRDRRK